MRRRAQHPVHFTCCNGAPIELVRALHEPTPAPPPWKTATGAPLHGHVRAARHPTSSRCCWKRTRERPAT